MNDEDRLVSQLMGVVLGGGGGGAWRAKCAGPAQPPCIVLYHQQYLTLDP